MKKIIRLLKGKKHICFLDFEGTQFTGEMIAYGAVVCTIDKQGHIKKSKNPILFYVRAKNKIGHYVENLTHIDQKLLDKLGISFSTAMNNLKHYCGLHFQKTAFVTFGNNDLRILNQSIMYNLDSPKEITSVIHHNYIDFQAIISSFIRDNSNNPLSLEAYCQLFEIGFEGEAHNPKFDAINLMRLYEAILDKKDVLLENYLRTLYNTKHLPDPISKVMEKLNSGQTVDPDDFKKFSMEDLE